MKVYLVNGSTLEADITVHDYPKARCWGSWLTIPGVEPGYVTFITVRLSTMPDGSDVLIETSGTEVDVYAKSRAIEDALNGH